MEENILIKEINGISDADKIKVYAWFMSQLEQLIKQANLALNAPKGVIVHVGSIKLESLNDTNN